MRLALLLLLLAAPAAAQLTGGLYLPALERAELRQTAGLALGVAIQRATFAASLSVVPTWHVQQAERVSDIGAGVLLAEVRRMWRAGPVRLGLGAGAAYRWSAVWDEVRPHFVASAGVDVGIARLEAIAFGAEQLVARVVVNLADCYASGGTVRKCAGPQPVVDP